jgi:hypothetical protein
MFPSRASEIRWHSGPSEGSHRRDIDTNPFMRSGEVVRRMVEKEETIHDVPFGLPRRATCVALADNAAATTSGLVLHPGLTCVRPRSGHPALLLQRRVFPGRKRSYGEMHDGGSRGFRRGVGREFKLCTTHIMDHGSFRYLSALTHTRTNTNKTGHTCERIVILENLAQIEDA